MPITTACSLIADKGAMLIESQLVQLNIYSSNISLETGINIYQPQAILSKPCMSKCVLNFIVQPKEGIVGLCNRLREVLYLNNVMILT